MHALLKPVLLQDKLLTIINKYFLGFRYGSGLAGIDLFNVSNGNISTTSEIILLLAIKTQE